MKKILLTSTSFQDTPGKHQELLNLQGFEIDTLRGPVKEDVLLPIIGNYDGIICGDDEITENVIKVAKSGKIQIISKYGVGLDKIDLEAAKKYDMIVTNCPGVNHTTVAEHTIALLLAFYKKIPQEYNYTKSGKWTRLIGSELYKKKIGIIGLGKIGKEVVKRIIAFGLEVHVFDKFIDEEFVHSYQLIKHDKLEDLLYAVDIISLNVALNEQTQGLISKYHVQNILKKGVVIVNTARALLIDQDALFYGLEQGIIGGYLTDVMDEEPMVENHPLIRFDNVIITPHIGSRTYESVERQGIMAVENLLKHLSR